MKNFKGALFPKKYRWSYGSYSLGAGGGGVKHFFFFVGGGGGGGGERGLCK